jgi:hypothetical protein
MRLILSSFVLLAVAGLIASCGRDCPSGYNTTDPSCPGYRTSTSYNSGYNSGYGGGYYDPYNQGYDNSGYYQDPYGYQQQNPYGYQQPYGGYYAK